MEQVVKDAAAKVPPKAEPKAEAASTPEKPAVPANVCAALKGISSSLLEKVSRESQHLLVWTNGPLVMVELGALL